MTEPVMLLFSVAFEMHGDSEKPEVVIFTDVPAVTPDTAIIKALTEKLDDARKIRIREIRVARSARFENDKPVYSDTGEPYDGEVGLFWRSRNDGA